MALADVESCVLGYYCDTLTPLEKTTDGYKLQDLMLDVWIGADGRVRVLDRDEFNGAVSSGQMSAVYGEKAMATVDWICREHAAGRFPGKYIQNM